MNIKKKVIEPQGNHHSQFADQHSVVCVLFVQIVGASSLKKPRLAAFHKDNHPNFSFTVQIFPNTSLLNVSTLMLDNHLVKIEKISIFGKGSFLKSKELESCRR